MIGLYAYLKLYSVYIRMMEIKNNSRIWELFFMR